MASLHRPATLSSPAVGGAVHVARQTQGPCSLQSLPRFSCSPLFSAAASPRDGSLASKHPISTSSAASQGLAPLLSHPLSTSSAGVLPLFPHSSSHCPCPPRPPFHSPCPFKPGFHPTRLRLRVRRVASGPARPSALSKSLSASTLSESATPSAVSKSVSQSHKALSEIAAVFDRISKASNTTDPFATLVQEVLAHKSGHIVLYGVGREGLMMRALAMRLFHLGLRASVVGDMSAPAVGQGDLFIASAGPGSFSTVSSLLQVARGAGSRTVVLTAQPEGESALLADAVVYLPAQTMADDGDAAKPGAAQVLPMGSVYEAAMFVFCEVVVHQLRDGLNETALSMRARHTNLE